jgi:hypothetical protein
MKFTKNTIIAISIFATLLTTMSCKKDQGKTAETIDPPGAPPKTWQEHWGHHQFMLKRVYYDDNVAVYYDKFMDTTVTWPYKAMSDSWAYAKKHYGEFGKDQHLYVILHNIVDETNPLGGGDLDGGHPASWRDPTHDFHNTIDNGLDDWTYPTSEQIGIPIHEIAHIVSNTAFGHAHEDRNLWGDSKFAEIFNYDVLMNIGRKDEAERVYDQMQHVYDNFPRSDTQWFKNWFYPIYSKYGKVAVLSKYFAIVAKSNPENRDINWGEFVHFWSQAAGANLKSQATIAFGWNDEWDEQFKQAQKDFPGIKY